MCHGWPVKKIYIYIQDNPGNLKTEGKQKTVQVRGNVSFGVNFSELLTKGMEI